LLGTIPADFHRTSQSTVNMLSFFLLFLFFPQSNQPISSPQALNPYLRQQDWPIIYLHFPISRGSYLPLPSCLSWLLNIYRCINPTLNIWCLSLVKLPTTTCKLLLTHKCILNVRGPNPSSKNPISAMRPLLLWCGLIFYLIMRRKLESFIKNSIMGIGNKEKQNQRIALVMYPGGGPAIGCWSEASSIHSELIPTTVTAKQRLPFHQYSLNWRIWA
jgi:hypothetical protein